LEWWKELISDVDRKGKAVVQVAGMHSLVRIDSDNQNRRDWFKKVSLCMFDDQRANAQSNRIFVPNSHPVLMDERAKKRLGGQIFTSEKAKVVDVLVDVLPQIQDFVTGRIPAPTLPVVNGNGIDHSMESTAMETSTGPAVLV
jgi:histone deacetylase 6